MVTSKPVQSTVSQLLVLLSISIGVVEVPVSLFLPGGHQAVFSKLDGVCHDCSLLSGSVFDPSSVPMCTVESDELLPHDVRKIS